MAQSRFRSAGVAAAALLLGACGGGGTSSPQSAPEPVELSAAAALGEDLPRPVALGLGSAVVRLVP